MESRRNFWKHLFADIDEGEIGAARGDKQLQKRKKCPSVHSDMLYVCICMYELAHALALSVAKHTNTKRFYHRLFFFLPCSLLLYRENK